LGRRLRPPYAANGGTRDEISEKLGRRLRAGSARLENARRRRDQDN